MHFLCLQCARLVNPGLLNNSDTFYDLIPRYIKEKNNLKRKYSNSAFWKRKEAISSVEEIIYQIRMALKRSTCYGLEVSHVLYQALSVSNV